MTTFTLHDVRAVSTQRPFQWEGDIQIGQNLNRTQFTAIYKETAFTLKAFGSRAYPAYAYNADNAPKWEEIEPILREGLQQLMQRDTFATYAEVQGWTLEEANAADGDPATPDTSRVEVVVVYTDQHRNRPVVLTLADLPSLLATAGVTHLEIRNVSPQG